MGAERIRADWVLRTGQLGPIGSVTASLLAVWPAPEHSVLLSVWGNPEMQGGAVCEMGLSVHVALPRRTGLATVMPILGPKFLVFQVSPGIYSSLSLPPAAEFPLGHGPGQQPQNSMGTYTGQGKVQFPSGTLPYGGDGKL